MYYNNTTCFPDNINYKIVTALSASVAAVSALACVLVTLGIICSKKYLVFTQRLILYLSIAATCNASSEILRLHRVFFNPNYGWQAKLCMASGFFEQLGAWWQLLAVSCITLSVLVKVLWRGTPERVGPLFPATIFLFPLAINWVPFIHNTYGRAGAWCWIKEKNEDCSNNEFGQYLRFVLWFIPLYIILFIVVVSFFVILFKINSDRRRWQGRYDPAATEQREKMKKEVWPLLWYPAFYIFLNIFPLINRIQGAIHPNNPILALWILHAICSPLQGGFVSVAYALDSETVRRLNCIRQFRRCYTRTPQVREYHHEVYTASDSLLLGKKSYNSEEM